MRRPIRILTLAAVAPLTVAALAACTQAPLPSLPTSSASPSPTPTVAGLPVTTIATLAKREVGEGTVVAVQDEAAGSVWDVRVVQTDGSVQEVHLSTRGAVLAGPSSDTTDADAESANRAQVAAVAVSLSSAYDRMLAAVSGGTVTAIQLDEDDSRVVWRGDVVQNGVRHDVRIDAVNGSVLLNQADASPTASATSGS